MGQGWRTGRGVAVATAALALAALLAGCSDGGGGKPPDDGLVATAETGIIRGVVIDAGIRPLAGANVSLAMDPPRWALTGEDGSFGFDQLAPGTYRLSAHKPGFAEASTAVDVEAGVEDPRAVKLLLTFNPSLIPFSTAYVFEGFVECSFHLRGGYLAACAAGPIANNLLCSGYDVCPGNVTNDRVFAFQPVDGPPDFLQSELVWESNQALGEQLMLFQNYGTLDEFNGGGFAGTFNTTMGLSPLMLTVNRTEMEDAELGTTNHMVPEVLAGANEATHSCLPDQPVARPCGGYGLAVEQQFQLFTHLFYNYLPPPAWRFSDAGGVPPPPA